MTTARPFAGSFRDPTSRVFEVDGAIVRGVDNPTLANFRSLTSTRFYRNAEDSGAVVRSTVADAAAVNALAACGWRAALSHDRVPLISYPYEWTFSMLKDAALLHLDLLEACYQEGWTLKDATPYNVQFVGSQPIFIDIPSFVPRLPGDYWIGYRQFCMMFLYPLMLKAHLQINFNGPLKSNLDGLTPSEFARYFAGVNRIKRGVLKHVTFPALMEQALERRERDSRPIRKRPQIKHSDAMVLGLLRGLRRTVEKLKSPVRHTDWSEYATRHSYEQQSFDEKVQFVGRAVESRSWRIGWDLGSNTGIFSRICASQADYTIAVDGDHDAVDKLYLSERLQNGKTILPLVMNLANISPNHGWSGIERSAFDQRNRPDLVLALALIHHLALSANVPIPLFLDWLLTLDARVIIEFVDRHDEMVEKLLKNKRERYEAYNLEAFESELRKRFEIISSKSIKDGRRRIYSCRPHPS